MKKRLFCLTLAIVTGLSFVAWTWFPDDVIYIKKGESVYRPFIETWAFIGISGLLIFAMWGLVDVSEKIYDYFFQKK